MKEIKSIGIDIGKKKCVVCVMDSDGTVLEESSYDNQYDEATKFAKGAKAKYVECQAVCESTGNHWIKTADALEKVGIPLEFANPFKTKAIAWASIKNDKVDARTLAHLLRFDLVDSCYIGDSKSRGEKQLIRHAIRLVHDRTRALFEIVDHDQIQSIHAFQITTYVKTSGHSQALIPSDF